MFLLKNTIYTDKKHLYNIYNESYEHCNISIENIKGIIRK